MGAKRAVTKLDKQRAATERWLSKPGYGPSTIGSFALNPVFRIREEQREKARLRAAR